MKNKISSNHFNVLIVRFAIFFCLFYAGSLFNASAQSGRPINKPVDQKIQTRKALMVKTSVTQTNAATENAEMQPVEQSKQSRKTSTVEANVAPSTTAVENVKAQPVKLEKEEISPSSGAMMAVPLEDSSLELKEKNNASEKTPK